jgi:hypothetical protein
MTKDIRASVRQIATNDSAQAIAATAAAELIKKVATSRKQPEQQDGRVVASGLGGFAVGAGAATLATTAVKGIGKLVGRRRHPLFADVPKKAAKAVEVPKEAVDRFASGLRDQVSGGSKPSRTARRPASTGSARKSSARRSSASKSTASGARTRAKSTRSSNGSSGRKSSASKSSAGGTRTRAKTSRSSNGSTGRTSAKSTRSSNGSSGRSRATASGRR